MKTEIKIENKELLKRISKLDHYSVEQFQVDAQRYIKAIKEYRMTCVVRSVSISGMSRVLSFTSCEKSKDKRSIPYYFSNYFSLFIVLGFAENKKKNGFTIYGCGMDMVFNTNYTIIRSLNHYGLISKKECDILAQMTPRVL